MESTKSQCSIINTLVKTPEGYIGVVTDVNENTASVQLDTKVVEYSINELTPHKENVKLIITRGKDIIPTGEMHPEIAVQAFLALTMSKTWTRIRSKGFIYREKK